MKKILSWSFRGLLIMFLFITFQSFGQTQMSREEIALKKAEDKVESNRLKLVDIKRDINSADSLFVAGEKLEEDARIRKAEGRDEMKAIEKQFKSDSKPASKEAKNKDRSIAAQGKAELKEITSKYKADLKVAESKVKLAEKDISTAGRMIDKADKKLDMLKTKLKAAEKAYEDAEKALEAKQEGK